MVNFIETDFPGLVVVEPKVFGDERGFFMESYNEKDFSEGWIPNTFIQDNHSKSRRNVLRGLHYQVQHTQSKLVRVIAGSVYDVAVDLREGSPTYGKRFGIELSAENKKQLFVPKWFAHGFVTKEDDTEFLYKCDDIYHQASEGGILRNDPTLDINRAEHCDINNLVLSPKDTKNQLFEVFRKTNPFMFQES